MYYTLIRNDFPRQMAHLKFELWRAIVAAYYGSTTVRVLEYSYSDDISTCTVRQYFVSYDIWNYE